MAHTLPVTIDGPKGRLGSTFGEATDPAQRVVCYDLAAAAFGAPLSGPEYREREEHLGGRPLLRDGGWRFWCLASAADPLLVYATCKTIRRDLLVRDGAGADENGGDGDVRIEPGYCIAAVVTDDRFRGYGLAAALLRHVAEWLDAPGRCYASMLYTIVGDFYVDKGWQTFPVSQGTILTPDTHPTVGLDMPETRTLKADEIADLCQRDVLQLKQSFSQLDDGDNNTHVAVLPTHEMISLLHDRASFISSKTCPGRNHVLGATCASGNAWMYWYHDLRSHQLTIQRIHPAQNSSTDQAENMASLFMCALKEARNWDMPRVVVWNVTFVIDQALKLLHDQYEIKSSVEDEAKNNIPSLRMRGRLVTEKIRWHSNEFYAWS